jgi:hypothetical protein
MGANGRVGGGVSVGSLSSVGSGSVLASLRSASQSGSVLASVAILALTNIRGGKKGPVFLPALWLGYAANRAFFALQVFHNVANACFAHFTANVDNRTGRVSCVNCGCNIGPRFTRIFYKQP